LEIATAGKTALVFGYTGLIGGHLIKLLLSHSAYEKVILLGRKPLDLNHPKLKQHVINMDDPSSYESLVKGNDCFVCLGTTMAKAGSKEAFYKVDYTYCHEIGLAAAKNSVNQFLIVTAMGSDPNSLIFYNKVKGQLEASLMNLPFWAIHVFQPSLLLGDRSEKRFGESVAAFVGKGFAAITGSLFKKYLPIKGEDVAAAMLLAANQLNPGKFKYTSDQLQDMASRYFKS